MKNLINILFFLSLVVTTSSCSTGNENKKVSTKKSVASEVKTGEVKVYYFHTDYRCKTCRTVERSTGEDLKLLYAEAFKDGTMTYQAINIGDTEHQDLVKKYRIAGQTLLFTRDDKVIDKTAEAFMNATTKPDKWKSIVKDTVEELLDI